MVITINDNEIEVVNGETVLETAERAGCIIPTLCYAKNAVHKSSCMVCAVKNQANGQIIPACSTYPTAGMMVETDSEEVRQIRTLSLELLLSDHRADCEAPCSMVCPKGLDIEKMLRFYDDNQYEMAYALIATFFSLPDIACDICKTPCEKACRRGTVDSAVPIRNIIREVVGMSFVTLPDEEMSKYQTDKSVFQSRPGRFSTSEKERLKKTVTTSSRCLHCACAGSAKCKLRIYATTYGIKRPRYEASSALPVMHKQLINENIGFEQAKCIRCGLCVYNSKNSFTFKDRGFGMSVILPKENRLNFSDELVALCPTGAIYKHNANEV